jgi:hypothetical protein
MTTHYKEKVADQLRSGEVWGICATDSFRMVCYIYDHDIYHYLSHIKCKGIDIQNLVLIIQYKVTCNMCTLWQCFGHAARDRTLVGTALFFVESKYFDEERQKKADRKTRK